MVITGLESSRWLRRAFAVVVPLLVLYAIFRAPAWIHDHQLAKLVDRGRAVSAVVRWLTSQFLRFAVEGEWQLG